MAAGDTLMGIGVNNARRFGSDNDELNSMLFGEAQDDIVVPSQDVVSTSKQKEVQEVGPIVASKSDVSSTVNTFSEITKLIRTRLMEQEASRIKILYEIETLNTKKDTLIEENHTEAQRQSELTVSLTTYTSSLEAQLAEYTETFSGFTELAKRVANKDTPLIEKTEVFVDYVAEIGSFIVSITEKDDENNSVLQNMLIAIAMTRAEIARIQSEIEHSKEKVSANVKSLQVVNNRQEEAQRDLEKLDQQIEKQQKRLNKVGSSTLSILEQPKKSIFRRVK